jgi:hypothetical protein
MVRGKDTAREGMREGESKGGREREKEGESEGEREREHGKKRRNE